jgi:hypothetical protein
LFRADKVLTSVTHLLPQLKLRHIEVKDSIFYKGESDPAQMWDDFGDEFGEGESDDEDWEDDAAGYGIDDYDNDDFIGVDSEFDHGYHDSLPGTPTWASGWNIY